MHVQLYSALRSDGGLPISRNMPYVQSSMPSQSQPRNMTGIYLGLEGNLKPPRPKTGVPPLARSRGSSRMRTPTEEQRYRKVELLRIKEEKRGFSGNPVKRHQHIASAHADNSSGTPSHAPPSAYSAYSHDAQHTPGGASDAFHSRRWGPGKLIDPTNLDDLLRPSQRNFTTVSNSGVTRSEKLTGWLDGGGQRTQQLPPSTGEMVGMGMAREVGRVTNEDLAGLEECFRKVCKGNVEVLYSLLPGRKQQQPRRDNTGFTVRSYRNPNQAEILADFTAGRTLDRSGRPKTVPVRRPIVPQPYFFRHYSTHPGAAAIAAQHRHHNHLGSVASEEYAGNYFHSTSKILASPGAGSISRSLTQRLQTPTTLIPTSVVTEPAFPRHASSPTDDIDRIVDDDAKGFQSGESTSRTVQDSEDSVLTETPNGPRAVAGGATAAGPEVHVAVLPTVRPLDTTNDSSTTLDDSITPRPAPEADTTADSTPRPAPEADTTADPDPEADTAAGPAPSPTPDADSTVGPTPSPVPEAEADSSAESTARPAFEGPDAPTAATIDSASPPRLEGVEEEKAEEGDRENDAMDEKQASEDTPTAMVRVTGGDDDNSPSTTEDQRPRPKLTASNSGADIMLGLETDEGQSAEVEIDAADQEELMPEEAPKGRVRKASITEKVIKTKASEAMAAIIKEEAESRQREFEKLLDEHAELVQEISRTPSSENLIQGERDH